MSAPRCTQCGASLGRPHEVDCQFAGGAVVGSQCEIDLRSKPSNPKDVVGISKVPASVVSQIVLMEVNLAMMEGALKYGRHNFRDVGVRASIYFDATMRHLTAWYEGQDTDPDSGLSHVTKAIASLTVLRDAFLTGRVTDDRPPPMPDLDGFLLDLHKKAQALVARYGSVNPKHITKFNVSEVVNETRSGLERRTLEHPTDGSCT